ncbi:hypothetical protein CC80DRAFT_191471 [Byssothecium circinans]|uniref:Uncharacterized protein n=1 Tax=Byssothecium circinans TaxID=147558 RepID=A0A6A5TFU1_9PLEO|nr:hypothetical protein CC80DRAFT_191471 [Byssothecium circinans]
MSLSLTNIAMRPSSYVHVYLTSYMMITTLQANLFPRRNPSTTPKPHNSTGHDKQHAYQTPLSLIKNTQHPASPSARLLSLPCPPLFFNWLLPSLQPHRVPPSPLPPTTHRVRYERDTCAIPIPFPCENASVRPSYFPALCPDEACSSAFHGAGQGKARLTEEDAWRASGGRGMRERKLMVRLCCALLCLTGVRRGRRVGEGEKGEEGMRRFGWVVMR